VTNLRWDQPDRNLAATSRGKNGSGNLADSARFRRGAARLDCCDRVRGSKHGLRSQNVVDAFFAQTAKTVTGSQDPALTSPNLSDYAGPSATVANTLSLPPEFPDAIRDICHPCHPLSGAIAITPSGRQLNMTDPAHASGCPIVPDAGRRHFGADAQVTGYVGVEAPKYAN